jgi:hypothetical protein
VITTIVNNTIITIAAMRDFIRHMAADTSVDAQLLTLTLIGGRQMDTMNDMLSYVDNVDLCPLF